MSGEVDKFCLSFAAFIFESLYTQHSSRGLSMSPRDDVKHVACGVAVIQVFTCESLNVGGSARVQKSLSQQDIYRMDCPLVRFPLKHHSPLSRRHISANHTRICWGDGCASGVAIQQYDTD